MNSYIDFGPYHESFKKFESYLERFLKDIKDPELVGALADLTQDKAQGHSYMPGTKTYFGPGTCKGGSYSCRVQKQYLRILSETRKLRDLFRGIYSKFLQAIDHMEYHPTLAKEKKGASTRL